MQKLCVLLPVVIVGVVIVGGLAGTCAAQDAAYYGGSCQHSAPCCNQVQRTTLMAHVGNFNCRCRGSYKFPVPPQYTYHWPGMYAQQCVGAYRSPWRFPSLMLYQNQLVRARDTSARMVRLGPPPRLSGPDNSKPAGQ